MTVTPRSAELLALAEWIKHSHSVDEYITVQIPIALRESVIARLAAKPADQGWHEPAAKWLEQEADQRTNSLHCGDNSITIQRTHNTASALKLSAKIIRALSTEAPKP